MIYNSRGLKRRRNTDKWEVALAHRDPMTGEIVLTYHTVEATTRKKAEKARDKLIEDLEQEGSACTSQMTIKEFFDEFIKYKEDSGVIERLTLDNYRKHAKVVCRHLGGEYLAEVGIPRVNGWMVQMTAEGYAPRSVQKPFSMLRSAMGYAVAIDLITKNPCEFCKPPKIKRKKLQVLDRDERTRMLELVRAVEPAPLALAIEIAPHDRHAPRRDMRDPLVGLCQRRLDKR